jgi:predicted small metal-binding protein
MKHYSCACGWDAEAETFEVLIDKIRKHAKEKHPSIKIDETQTMRFISEK